MSASFRGTPRGGGGNGGGAKTRKFDDYEEFEGENEGTEAVADIPASGKLAIGVAESAWGFGSNVVQVMTSCVAVMAMIIGAVTIDYTAVPDLVRKFPMYAVIGMGIAGGIQIVLHMNAQPLRATVDRLKHIQMDFKNGQALQDIKNAITFRSLLFVMAIAGDIVSDATFVNLFTHNWLVILFWIVFTTGSSTIVMYDGWSRVHQAIEDWKDYRYYHRMFEED